MRRLYILLLIAGLASCTGSRDNKDDTRGGNLPIESKGDFRSWAPTPPMGWNSYNCYGAAVTETEVKANAAYMAEMLRKFGWEYIVVDYCWSYPHPPGSIQNNPPQFRLKIDGAYVPWLAMDEYGRLLPDLRKFPSSSGNNGFKLLSDYVHSLGLKFGIHVMRGIPRQAAWAKSPIEGAKGITADMIADTVMVCDWLNQMYGVDMSKPGAQEYYNSLARLYASWEVDYIKMDDADLNREENTSYMGAEAEAMHKAILNCGRPMVLSISPRQKPENGEHLKSIANLFRISNDFWDDWSALKNQFELIDRWSPFRDKGTWPDADMLQLGRISRRGPSGNDRFSGFTEDEQMTHMFLWCIAKSPLMMGGDMPENTDFVEKLLTNREIIDVNQKGINPRQVYRDDISVIWSSEVPDSKALNIAVFNIGDNSAEIELPAEKLGIGNSFAVTDLWDGRNLGTYNGKFSWKVNPHGGRLFRFAPVK